MPKVSSQYKEDRTEHILSSADFCFAKKGYDRTTLDDIVEQSQTSKGAIYNYFDSKEDIYLTLAERRTNAHRQDLQEKLAKIDCPTKKLKRLFELDLHEKTDLERRLDLEFWINASKNEKLRKRLILRAQESVDLIATILEEGKATGEFRSDMNSKLVSELYWSIADGTNNHLLVLKEKLPYEKIIKTTHKMIWNYIQK